MFTFQFKALEDMLDFNSFIKSFLKMSIFKLKVQNKTYIQRKKEFTIAVLFSYSVKHPSSLLPQEAQLKMEEPNPRRWLNKKIIIAQIKTDISANNRSGLICVRRVGLSAEGLYSRCVSI